MESCHITLENVKEFLHKRSFNEEFHITTLRNTLNLWGFEFCKGTKTRHIKEKDHVVAARRRYLRRMRNNRLSGLKCIRPEVYLGESYIYKNHSNDFTWHWNEDGPLIQKPTVKGESLIIVNAITKNGWVTGACLLFKSTRKTGDYHGQMNWENFCKWFVEQLLPNIPENSLIVLDNAAYHNIFASCSAPTSFCTKEQIRTWLEKNKIPCSDDCLKPELVELLKKVAPEPTYEIDKIAHNHGHEVIRTPPYHPELQPMEICWGIVKNEVARNCDFTVHELEEQLDKAFKKITAETCQKVIKKVRLIEDKFWRDDEKIEKSLQHFVATD